MTLFFCFLVWDLMLFIYGYVNSLEYWAFEILVFLAGLAPNSETNTSLIAIW